jgi:anti-sigma regulatory factor (Ser/Thr protein kinase)
MMPEIALNILDVAQNSVRAEAKLTEISVKIDVKTDTLTVIIKDNGCGMTAEQLEHVCDPFFTTRTTRSIGLGVPFFKEAAEDTGGSFEITSEIGVGTTVTAIFGLSHIDRMPLGDMTFTVHSLVTFNIDKDFIYTYEVINETDGDTQSNSFTLSTTEFREVLGDVPFNEPEISDYIKEYLNENTQEINNGRVF